MVKSKKPDSSSIDSSGIVTPDCGDARELADELGVNTALDDLGSDVTHWYPTGCKILDIFLGKGVPSGKVIECSGWEGSYKSTLALLMSDAFDKYWSSRGKKHVKVFSEAESAFNKERTKYMGMNINNFLIKESIHVEDSFQFHTDAIKKAKAKDIKTFCITDTIAALGTENEVTKGDLSGGMQEKPRVIKAKLREMVKLLGENETTLIIVNQVYGSNKPYSEDISPGGGGMRFYPSIRIRTKIKEVVKKVLTSGEEVTEYSIVELYSRKNKLTTPGLTICLVFSPEKGIDLFETSYFNCVKSGAVKVKGSWKYLETEYNGKKVELTFQNTKKLKDDAEKIGFNLMRYMDYCIEKNYSGISPFIKVKLIESLWEYELDAFGKKVTILTDDEIAIAEQIGKNLCSDELSSEAVDADQTSK